MQLQKNSPAVISEALKKPKQSIKQRKENKIKQLKKARYCKA